MLEVLLSDSEARRASRTTPAALHRSSLYGLVARARGRGIESWDLFASMRGWRELTALDGLVSDGWIERHECYRGDGSRSGAVYVATGNGEGVRP
jgi:hypothetical protein